MPLSSCFRVCLFLPVLFLGLRPSASADVVRTGDGACLTGRVAAVADGVVQLETTYAGTVKVVLDQVACFETASSLELTLKDGTRVTGPVVAVETGGMRVWTEGGPVAFSTAQLATAWPPGRAPAPVSKKSVAESGVWAYELGVDLAGKEGNAEESSQRLSVRALRKNPNYKLQLYATHEASEKSGEQVGDEQIAGIDFSCCWRGVLGWYARLELEQDDSEGLDLRTVSAVGLSYRLIETERRELEARTGLSYRTEEYIAGESEQSVGLDLAVHHAWQFSQWGKMANHLTYIPSLEDTADYRLIHDSSVQIPLGKSDNWDLRLGLTNDFSSMPATGRERLDTTYYTRVVLKWQ